MALNTINPNHVTTWCSIQFVYEMTKTNIFYSSAPGKWQSLRYFDIKMINIFSYIYCWYKKKEINTRRGQQKKSIGIHNLFKCIHVYVCIWSYFLFFSLPCNHIQMYNMYHLTNILFKVILTRSHFKWINQGQGYKIWSGQGVQPYNYISTLSWRSVLYIGGGNWSSQINL